MCESLVIWGGTVEGPPPESVFIEGCVNERCLSRTMPVEPLGDCGTVPGTETVWVDDIASAGCSTVHSIDPPAIFVSFSIDLTVVEEELQDGDIGRLSVADAADGRVLVERMDTIDYDRRTNIAQPDDWCLRASIQWVEVSGG